MGDPVAIRLTGLKPGAEVTVSAQRPRSVWGPAVVFAAQARYAADAQGRIDLANTPPLGGSYAGADLRGLFWSMAPTPQPAPVDWRPSDVQLSARSGDAVLATATLRLTARRDGLRQRPVPADAGLPGALLFQPAGEAPRAALIVLGGSEGGVASVSSLAELWASQGYAALALPYYGPSGWGPGADGKPGPQPPEVAGLPASFAEIEVTQLQQAREWLAQQPGVRPDRIGLMGVSKGAEFALIGASRLRWPAAVVAIVPSDVVWEGWGPDVPVPDRRPSFAYAGKPLPFVPYIDFSKEFAAMDAGGEVRLRRMHDGGRAKHPDRVAAARIRVEDYAGPLMVIGGGDDQIWASGEMAQAIVDTRRAAGLTTEARIFEAAGHALSGTGWSPTTTLNAGPMKMGGQPAADARAQAEAFAATQAFLRTHLDR